MKKFGLYNIHYNTFAKTNDKEYLIKSNALIMIMMNR